MREITRREFLHATAAAGAVASLRLTEGQAPSGADTGWFDPAYLRHLVDAHDAGTRDYSTPLWSLMMFEAFLRNVMYEPREREAGDVALQPA